MKSYLKEFIILFCQLFMFYIFPMFAGPTDAMGMVFLIILATLLLSFFIGLLSHHSAKFLYPPLIAVLFIPSVFIYYNESALVHSLWYLVISSVGLFAGVLVRLLVQKIKNNRRKI